MAAQNIVKKERTELLKIKCKHDIFPLTCSLCKHKPEYEYLKPLISGIKADAEDLKNNQTERVQIQKLKNTIYRNNQIDQKGDHIMKEEKVCIICGEKYKARGLCDKHYRQWKEGKIDHPELGPWKISDKGKNISTSLSNKGSKKSEEVIFGIEYGPVFTELRKRLKESKSLADTLIILGQGDQVKKEIEIFAQRFA